MKIEKSKLRNLLRKKKPYKNEVSLSNLPKESEDSLDYQKKKLEKKLKLHNVEKNPNNTTKSITTSSSKKNLTSLQLKMETKLKGAKFRWLNETLYTTESSESLKIFTEDPELFTIYHNGFRSQVQKWPVNPLSIFIKNLEKRRSFHGELVIADMGCGDAMISQTFKDQKNFKIHSFDLIAVNDSVTSCDIKHVPLKPSSVDIVVFCLSLMGTNFFDFIKEARRILKVGGEILIAEVESRFPKKRKFQEKDSLLSKSNNTKFFSEESENGIELFLKNLQIFGFELKKPVDFTYKVFILFHLVLKEKKTGSNGAKAIDGKSMLKPCLYKKR